MSWFDNIVQGFKSTVGNIVAPITNYFSKPKESPVPIINQTPESATLPILDMSSWKATQEVKTNYPEGSGATSPVNAGRAADFSGLIKGAGTAASVASFIPGIAPGARAALATGGLISVFFPAVTQKAGEAVIKNPAETIALTAATVPIIKGITGAGAGGGIKSALPWLFASNLIKDKKDDINVTVNNAPTTERVPDREIKRDKDTPEGKSSLANSPAVVNNVYYQNPITSPSTTPVVPAISQQKTIKARKPTKKRKRKIKKHGISNKSIRRRKRPRKKRR